MAAVMTREEIAAARTAAVERVRGRHSGEYRTHTEQQRREAWIRGEELTPHDWHAPAVRPAETLGDWLDDRVLEWGQMPHGEGALLVTVLEAARDSAEAACRALKAARALTPPQQWGAYRNISDWRTEDRASRLGAERLALALLAEWDRLRLPTEAAAAQPAATRRRRPWETAETEAAS
jgi:hypothetical protein